MGDEINATDVIKQELKYVIFNLFFFYIKRFREKLIWKLHN